MKKLSTFPGLVTLVGSVLEDSCVSQFKNNIKNDFKPWNLGGVNQNATKVLSDKFNG